MLFWRMSVLLVIAVIRNPTDGGRSQEHRCLCSSMSKAISSMLDPITAEHLVQVELRPPPRAPLQERLYFDKTSRTLNISPNETLLA